MNVQCGYVKVPTELPPLKIKTMKRLQEKCDKVANYMPKPAMGYGSSKLNRHAS